jgi:uncharacterized protein (TIGR02271 family)
MTTPGQWTDLIGSTAIDSDGEKVGKIGQIYLDDATGQPAWVTVSTGLFGMRESVAPLYNAQPSQGEVRLAVTKQMIKDAPNIDADAHLTESETGELYQYYANYLDPSVARTGADQPGGGDYTTGTGAGYTDRSGTAEYERSGTAEYEDAGVAGSRGYDTSGPTTDDAMTRSEERLNVGTENVTAGRARLRKYVVTEPVSTTVPVSHEEVRLEREPITDANAGDALSGADISEAEHEVTLRAERPVVDKETVPVERVRLGTETVTEEHQVNEEVRKEQIDEPDVDTGRRGDYR